MNIRIKEMRPSEAIVLVNCKCDAKALAKALMFKTFNSFGINISEDEAQQLTIRLIPEKSDWNPALQEVDIQKQQDN